MMDGAIGAVGILAGRFVTLLRAGPLFAGWFNIRLNGYVLHRKPE